MKRFSYLGKILTKKQQKSLIGGDVIRHEGSDCYYTLKWYQHVNNGNGGWVKEKNCYDGGLS